MKQGHEQSWFGPRSCLPTIYPPIQHHCSSHQREESSSKMSSVVEQNQYNTHSSLDQNCTAHAAPPEANVPIARLPW